MIRKVLSCFFKIRSLIHTRLSCNSRVKIGRKTLVFYKSSIISEDGTCVKIGRNCLIGRSKYGYHAGMPFYTTILVDEKDASVEIGDNCRLNGVYIHAKKKVKIGDNCVFASNVNIIDSNGHETNSLDRTIGKDEPLNIVIGNNVWIGLNVVILKGSIIGDNSIIAAGCVVKGVFPANSIISTNREYVVSQLKEC